MKDNTDISAHSKLHSKSEEKAKTPFFFNLYATYGWVWRWRASLQIPPTLTEGPSKGSKSSADSTPADTTPTRAVLSQTLVSHSTWTAFLKLLTCGLLNVGAASHLGIQQGRQMVFGAQGKQEDEQLVERRRRRKVDRNNRSLSGGRDDIIK